MRTLYHITDFDNIESILEKGLIGNPVVYVADQPYVCQRIRAAQKQLYEKHREGEVILAVDTEGYDLFHDPDTDASAWMIYADIPPQRIRLYF